MPPKRYSKIKRETKKIKEQKSTITSRLMFISLKVDDYVYRGKAISATKAAKFIKEVNGFKGKCVGDQRSLQVIEKLERQMIGIINEQNELNCDVSNNCTENSNHYNGSTKNTPMDKQYIDKQKKIFNQADKPIKPTSNIVYGKEVENDLSWMENLRYVREMSAEEKVPMYLQDSFWEGNTTVPNDWNDDFSSV